ncbi:hypothetical protein OROMI_022847 [Orobanche minor]
MRHFGPRVSAFQGLFGGHMFEESQRRLPSYCCLSAGHSRSSGTQNPSDEISIAANLLQKEIGKYNKILGEAL